jgi:cytoplasmic iron level regulating protein YaaA (DUF328/UPF0246 family)
VNDDPVLLLLPPSEGKAVGGRGAWREASGTFGDRLADRRRFLAAALVADLGEADPVVCRRLFGADGPLADRAIDAARALAAGASPAWPAWRRYTGVVWVHLDPASLPAAARRRIVVPNAATGLARGDDLVPDLRLKFSVSLGGTGRLDRWWQPALTEAVATHGRGPIIDLLPTEHAAALDLAAVAERRRVVRVTFVDDDGAGAVGHAAKAVKGTLARALLLDGIAAAAATFRWEGWRATRLGDEIVVRAPRPMSGQV